MSDEPSDVSAAQLVDAFIHPPNVVHVGFRAESPTGHLLIVNLVELWPWRTVVRGLGADKSAPMTPAVVRPRPDPRAPSGSVRAAVRGPDHDMLEQRRAHAAWYTGWRITDDVGTEYRSVGAGGGGSGGALWSDFRVEFQPDVPATARRLTITSPDDHEFSVRLDG